MMPEKIDQQTIQGSIRVLPTSLANQIAAGEVIQRPASVVKELLENALDAGADNIQLIIKDSGKTLIQVVDNGRGMNETDASLCFQRHATSKIRTKDDLFQIRSFGFRGEALASIAAIAHVELLTKKMENELGTYLLIEGGVIKKTEQRSSPDGTSITVRNLFYNVPARRKFLKSDAVELKHILEEFSRVAIPNPEVFFSVYHNENELYHFQGSNMRQRLVSYFGKNTNDQIVPVTEATDFISVSGFVGKPELIKKTRGDQYFFVNRRFIKSNYLNHAVKIAYENIIPKDHYPFYVLLIEIDPGMIDVNIHPTKQEVKFENERLIYNYIKVSVKHALGKYSITPSLDFETEHAGITDTAISSKANKPEFQKTFERSNKGLEEREKEKWLDFYKDIGSHSNDYYEGQITLSSDWSDLDGDENISLQCFQIHDSYIISPIKSGWMVIDQSSAHERILYEHHLLLLEEKQMVSQANLFPETITLDPKNVPLFNDLLEELKFLGFQIEKFGSNTFVVNGLPAMEIELSTNEFLNQFIETYYKNQELQMGIKENLARSMAQQLKIKKGKTLSNHEMNDIIDRLFACEVPYNTPGGKRCFVTFGLDELEKRFRN